MAREHGLTIFAALAHLLPDQHALGVDVADPQHDDLAATQAGAIGNAQRRLVLSPGPGAASSKRATSSEERMRGSFLG